LDGGRFPFGKGGETGAFLTLAMRFLLPRGVCGGNGIAALNPWTNHSISRWLILFLLVRFVLKETIFANRPLGSIGRTAHEVLPSNGNAPRKIKPKRRKGNDVPTSGERYMRTRWQTGSSRTRTTSPQR